MVINMNSLFKSDYYRLTGEKITFLKFIKNFLFCQEIKYLYFYRMQNKNIFNKCMFKFLSRKNGLEIFSTKIGAGLYIGHPYCITVNPDAVIGENCNIHKGVTIGRENRGKRKGSPIIGNNVAFLNKSMTNIISIICCININIFA